MYLCLCVKLTFFLFFSRGCVKLTKQLINKNTNKERSGSKVMWDENEMGVISSGISHVFWLIFVALSYATNSASNPGFPCGTHFIYKKKKILVCIFGGPFTVHKVTKAYCTKTIHRFIQLTKDRREYASAIIFIFS